MCGIVGYVHRGREAGELSVAMRRALQWLSHRGPDDEGVWEERGVGDSIGFGHRRLSILDLTPTGHQPMISAGGRYVIVLNGEIYNYRAVRTDLEALGTRFRSTGDTEVVVEAFAKWGIACVDRFIGMFAFAIWDGHERRLYLVRDRVGVKPLYYCVHEETLAFASELRGLQAFGFWRRDIDRDAMAEFFQFGYIAGSRSIFGAVRTLEPGTYATYSGTDGLRVKRYWSLEAASEAVTVPTGFDAAKERLNELLDSACAYRLVSDVPVGVFLSGGIDSSLVTAILAKRLNADTHTFTIGFSEPEFDESSWAAAVAEHLGARHTSLRVSMADAEKVADDWGDLFDEPFGDSSAIPTLLVSKLARSHVKVALSADGGDELFGGYVNYLRIPGKIRTLSRVPRFLRRGIGGVLSSGGGSALLSRALRIGSLHSTTKADDRARKLGEALVGGEPSGVFELAISYNTPRQVEQLVGAGRAERPALTTNAPSLEEAMMQWDYHHYLPSDILVKVDRMSMRVGLEGREPLLDHRLAEFAFACPLHLKIGALGSKHLLRSVLYDLVPRHLIDRPKQGFGIPLADWLRKGKLNDHVRHLLDSESLYGSGLVDRDYLKREVRGFLSGAHVDPHRIWLLVAFELWRAKWLVHRPA